MNPTRSFFFLGLLALFTLLPSVLSASLGASTPKRDLSGKIVEIHSKSLIVVLEDFKGWDREQTGKAAVVAKPGIRRWLKGLGPTQAAIYLKAGDMKGLKEGMILEIKGYSYAFAGSGNGHGPVSVVSSYEALQVAEPGKRPK